jgi:SpoVK/Ycf46/Vps4 family AAA+-type ATPase
MGAKKMESERELKCLAAVWALRAIMTPEGFKKFDLDEGEVFWGNENLKELVNYWRESQTPNTIRLLSSNSLRSVNKGLNSVPLTRRGHFFVNLAKLQNLLHLSDEEREVLLFSLLFNEVKGLAEAVHEARTDGPGEFFSHVSRIIRVAAGEIRRALQKDSPLSSSGLIQFDADRRFCGIEPLRGLYDALFKPGAEVEDLLSAYFSKSPAPRLHIKDFSHHPDLKILTGYLRRALEGGAAGNNVLIYGPPGTGKTELARSLAYHLEARLFEVSSEDEDGDPVEGDQRFRSYLLCQRVVSRNPRCIILFDEIEDVFPLPLSFLFGSLRTSGRHKGWTNRVLETNTVPTLWICNELDGMDPAVIRRFDLIIEVSLPPVRARQKMLGQMLSGLKVEKGFLQEMAQNVNLAPGHIEKAVKVARCCNVRNTKGVEDILRKVIGNAQRALGFPKPRPFPDQLGSSYHLDHVNADHNLQELINCCKRQASARIFLYGPSGAGKTALVHYLGLTLGKPVLVKNASDLLRPYVGQTEMEIAGMFREAEDQEGILFVDEVDSFLHNRQQASQSWQITQVNELLAQLERFPGLFVCATNLRENLDAAVFRRFDFKIKLDYLGKEQAWGLFRALLKELGVRLSSKEAPTFNQRMARLRHLAPGDFAVIRRKALMAGKRLGAGLLVGWLEQEAASKPINFKATIGFS